MSETGASQAIQPVKPTSAFDRHQPRAYGYALDVFGRPEYRDPVVPVQILMVMMGFAILLINNVFVEANRNWVNGTAILSGTCYLLAYMFYLTEYYDRLWEPYFLLPEDKLFFRFYSVTVGIVVIALMANFPQYWSVYVLGLFLIMYAKKATTRNAYIRAVKAEYGSFEQCPDPKVKAKYRLAEAFTHNFLVWGFWFLVPFSVIMTVAAICIARGTTINLKYVTVSPMPLQIIYVGTSIFITLFTVAFWKGKITKGILEMRDRVEAGDDEFFQKM